LAAADVFDPDGVEDYIGNLYTAAILNAFEDGEEQGDVLDSELVGCDVDAVADIVWVLDEEEDAGTENFLACRCKDERKR